MLTLFFLCFLLAVTDETQLIMRATNPRDVSYIFREYARKIHAKVHKDDPNLLKLSIACGKASRLLFRLFFALMIGLDRAMG